MLDGVPRQPIINGGNMDINIDEKTEVIVCEQELTSEPVKIWGFNTNDWGEIKDE